MTDHITLPRAVVDGALACLVEECIGDVFYAETVAALRAALAEQEQGRKKRKPKNSTTPLGIVCFEAYARSKVGSNRWDIAAEAVRAALAASEANEGRDE